MFSNRRNLLESSKVQFVLTEGLVQSWYREREEGRLDSKDEGDILDVGFKVTSRRDTGCPRGRTGV